MKLKYILSLFFVFISLSSFNSLAQEFDARKGEFDLKYSVFFKGEDADEDEGDDDAANLINADLTSLDCRYSWNGLVDSRQNKETIGINFRVPLLAQNVDSWIANLSNDIEERVHQKSPNASHTITVSPEVTRMYTYAQSLNILGVLAVKVVYKTDGKPVLVKNYRGFAAKTNWNNGIGEYSAAVNLAAENLVVNITNDMSSLCSNFSS